jgi:lipopolysaccharide assembly outer membrane protein LptD (OstA)
MFCVLIGQATAQEQPQAPKISLEQLRAMLEKATIAPNVKGNIILRDGATISAEGEVEIRTREITIHADKAVVDTETGEIQASGKVRIVPVAPPQKVKDAFPTLYERLQLQQ